MNYLIKLRFKLECAEDPDPVTEGDLLGFTRFKENKDLSPEDIKMTKEIEQIFRNEMDPKI